MTHSADSSHTNNPSTNHNPYADIIHHPRPVSLKHKPMSRANRAAQFSPYAALVGHKDLVKTIEDDTIFDEPEIVLDPAAIAEFDTDVNDQDLDDAEFDAPHFDDDFYISQLD